MSAKAKAKAQAGLPKIRATSNAQQQPSSPSRTRDGKITRPTKRVVWRQPNGLDADVISPRGINGFLRDS
ncbi:MAG: hypothetical protein EZS28_020479 [Streblomastix strix]|uniref:Uncharacterized protein n=1 Tax=Streblomastix strix TaxID=222440 RepID=A0A5J4VMW5_9EUKA|nr:MAG: hypothetical protein EZS28_020479 [Streblomastix strix]